MREAGAAMTITTLTTIAGFACLGFATFRGVRELGLVAAFGLTVCLLASLHLLPVCFAIVRGSVPAISSDQPPIAHNIEQHDSGAK